MEYPLTAADQIAYNTWLAQEAHDRGLSIGLENDSDQVTELLPPSLKLRDLDAWRQTCP